MGFFQKIIDDFGLGQHKVDEEALYAQIALFKDDLKEQEGKYTNQDEAIQFRDKWADLYKEAKAARLGKKSPLWEERKQFTDTFDRLAEVLTGYNSAVIAAESKRCDALLSDIDGKNLDPQQRAVVLCNEKRMLVLAGAGSGKTLTIAGKVKYLCQEKGVSPEDILLIAFTHKKNGTKLLETYSYLSSEGRLLEYLDSLLKKNGVKYKEPDFTDIFESVYEKQSDRYFSEFIKLCATFVALFKSQGHKIDDLGSLQDNGVSSQKPFFRKRNAAFKMIVRPLMEAYDAFLREKGAVDFADMINLAAENVTAGQKVHPYRYVIIDEYQDISYARYRLVKAILDQTGANLLCVGDDWQSIFRFAGSDISLFTDFERYFGRSVIMRLERTYRNSQQLIDEAGRFVLRNPYQLKKSLVSPKSLDYPISFFCYDIAPFQMLRKAIDKIISEFGKDSSILILGRNKFDFEILIGSQLFQWHRDGTLMYWDSPETPIRFLTAHKSKGLEADNVILLNFQNSTLGFPNKIADDPVLALVLAEPEDFLYAEERRLLYVALTRTKNRVFVLTDSRKPSEFFKEFKPSKSVFILNKETDIADLPCCPKCRTGHLLSRRNERTGKFFVGCSNYPKCDYVVRDVTVLTEQKVCPQCGGFLVRRRGQYGEFYGCTNYPRCSYTEQISVEKKTGN